MSQNPEDSSAAANEEITDSEREMLEMLGEADEGEEELVRPVELPQHRPGKKTVGDKEVNLKMIMDVPVDVRVELGHTQISIRDVLKLGNGSIVELDRQSGSPADIVVNGKLVGHGDVVVINENFGVRITKLVDPEERLESL
jgi:flagellar motor switch protein FliN/FliY